MKNYILLVVCTLIFYNAGTAKIKPTQLTCEYLKKPTVVDIKHPRLSWINIADSNERGQEQTAWQVRVASTKDQLEGPDLWDSKKVESNQSIRIEYDGKVLESRQDCWWQVRVWDKNGEVSEWSEPAYWHMGLLEKSDWKATWIGAPWQGEEALPKPTNSRAPRPEKYPPPAPMFRKEFNVDKKVKKAVAYVTGLGYFEMYLNGKKVGDDVLVPNQTNYGKRSTLMQQNIPLPTILKSIK